VARGDLEVCSLFDRTTPFVNLSQCVASMTNCILIGVE